MPEDIKPAKMSIYLAILVILIAGVVAVVSVVMVMKNKETEHQFKVSAEGKVTAIPDIANITVGVYTPAQKTAATVVKANTEKMNGIIKALKAVGIEKKDIKTANYSLRPVYDWTDKTGRRLKGYEVRQNVKIKIRDLDKIGKVIQVTTEKGANQIGSINFTIDEPDELKAQAVKLAVEKAQAKAQRLASQAGLKLGKVINVVEGQSYIPQPRPLGLYVEKAAGAGESALSQPEIEPGQQEVRASVTLVYEVE